jgi:hypothetical protein
MVVSLFDLFVTCSVCILGYSHSKGSMSVWLNPVTHTVHYVKLNFGHHFT